MQLNEPFQLFTPQECQDIIQRAQAQEIRPGKVMGPDPQRVQRNNNVFWLEFPKSVYDRLWLLAEENFPDYPFTWFQTPLQISRYNAGEFYDWHSDTYTGHSRKSIRTLSLTATLQTAPDALFEIEGGHSLDLEPGWAVFFDSTVKHRACAPSQGQRWSLTVWYMKPNPEWQS